MNDNDVSWEPLNRQELSHLKELITRYEVNHVHQNVTADAFAMVRRAINSRGTDMNAKLTQSLTCLD